MSEAIIETRQGRP